MVKQMTSIRTLLVIEDNPGDARLICEMLDDGKSVPAQLVQAATLGDAEKILATQTIDLILLDLRLPDAMGLEALKRIRIIAPDVPLVVLTGMDEVELAAQSLRQGAQDYLTKGQFESRELLRTLRYAGERKRLEGLKSKFVSTVSHELRTPLTSIAASLKLLASGTPGIPGPTARLIDIAHANCLRLVRLVNDILDTEKLESGRVAFHLSRVDARSLVESVVAADQGVAESYGVRVEIVGVVNGVAYVRADADRLTQAFSNVLANAVKFSTQVVISVGQVDDWVRISVRDNGPGIPDNFRSRLFQRFAQADGSTTRRKGGTGLGLYIVKQIVDRLGGKVSLGDRDGVGTVFQIELPQWQGKADLLHMRQTEAAGLAEPEGSLERLAVEARNSLALAVK
jgi:signal transduction histidine kinase